MADIRRRVRLAHCFVEQGGNHAAVDVARRPSKLSGTRQSRPWSCPREVELQPSPFALSIPQPKQWFWLRAPSASVFRLYPSVLLVQSVATDLRPPSSILDRLSHPPQDHLRLFRVAWLDHLALGAQTEEHGVAPQRPIPARSAASSRRFPHVPDDRRTALLQMGALAGVALAPASSFWLRPPLHPCACCLHAPALPSLTRRLSQFRCGHHASAPRQASPDLRQQPERGCGRHPELAGKSLETCLLASTTCLKRARPGAEQCRWPLQSLLLVANAGQRQHCSGR